ncbi:hypothetical protein ABK040_014881 [Willaertia magna]
MKNCITILLIFISSYFLLHFVKSEFNRDDKIYILIPLPDSSHYKAFISIANSLLYLNTTTVNNLYMIYPHEYPGMEEMMKNAKFNLIKPPQKPGFEVSQILHKFNNFTKSEVKPVDRFTTIVKMFKTAYEAILYYTEKVLTTHPVISKALRKDKKNVIFIIDTLASSVIEYATFHKLEFIIVNTAATITRYNGIPKYLPQLPFETISLTRGREIIKEEGIFNYFYKIFYERIYLFFKFIYNIYPVINELNNFRLANGLPSQNGLDIEVVDNVNIHFTLPFNIFEYNTAYPRNHIFVGFNYLPKHQIMDKLPSFNESEVIVSNNQLVNNWLDKKKKEGKSVVFIAFGTKVNISLHHIRNIIKGLLQTDKAIEILVVYGRQDPSKMKEHIFNSTILNINDKERVFVQNWVNQPNVLKHSAVKLFISHAGANSLLESIDAEVPLLLFPIFGDQYLNSLRAEDAGIARAFFNIDNENDCDLLTKEVNYILQHEKEIKQKMKKFKLLKENVQLLNEEECLKHNLSLNSLAAANVIGKVSKYGSEIFIPKESNISSWEKVDILQVSLIITLTLVTVPILFMVKHCCGKRK